MRRFQDDTASRTHQPVEFLHRSDHVGNVLYHVNRAQLVKRIIAKRIRKMVQVAQHIGLGARIVIDADGAGELVDAAADVEDARGSHQTSVAA